jgi:hypothetical protein
MAQRQKPISATQGRNGILPPTEAVEQAQHEAAHAAQRTRTNAQQLSSTLSRTAEALEISAALAEEHCERRVQQGRASEAADERRAAERARRAAERARLHAAEVSNWVP